MTPVLFVLAAGVGAATRHAIAQLLCGWQSLLVVNTVGAGLLGFVLASGFSASTTTVLATGFCGALTTFSSFALEIRGMAWPTAAGYSLLTIGTIAAAASLGTSLGAGL